MDRNPYISQGSSTQQLTTWDLGNGNFGAGFGQEYDYRIIGPSGMYP